MLNLYDLLSPLDRKRINNFVVLYGVNNGYIGNEIWLKDWSDNKKKLFRLLGGDFIYKIPYEYKKNKNQIEKELSVLRETHPFFDEFFEELRQVFYKTDDNEFYWDIRYLFSITSFIDQKIPKPIKYKNEKRNNKTFQISKDGKYMKSLQKAVNYCFLNYDSECSKRILSLFEDLRIKHSLIFNEKIVKGNLCFSIHPLDFLTMSDNNSWSSCMSWIKEGCYHTGTIEMMNSNNVICVYLESQKPYYFYKENQSDEFTWIDKKWRQLFYCTKDIIVGGKSYPYANDDITKFALQTLRDFAQKNWNCHYTYGIEKYLDMKHIDSNFKMEKNKEWIHSNDTIKHNIIFDTKGMYNDMLNDQSIDYWCVRNKVKRNKLISISGKAKCACCGDNIIEDRDLSLYDYNERFRNTGTALCQSCIDDRFCEFCDNEHGHFSSVEFNECYYCRKCWSHRIRYCPDCGKPFDQFFQNNMQLYFKIKTNEQITCSNSSLYYELYGCCEDCFEKLKQIAKKDIYKEDEERVKRFPRIMKERSYYYIKEMEQEDMEKDPHFSVNLKEVPFPKELELKF